MRPEIKAYHFDWMLWATLEHASKAADGSPGERRHLYRYIPYFKGILEPLLREGEPGIVFIKLINRYLRNIVEAHTQGKKVAATTFCFLPGIFYALDVVPVTLEVLSALGNLMWKRGMNDYLDYGCEVGFTETSCSSQRGALGAYLAGLGEKIDFIVCDTPGVCDTNANAYAFASEYLGIPFYYLNYPQVLGDDRSQAYHVSDYKALIGFLESQAGNRLSESRLRIILQEAQRQDELISDLEDMHCLVPTPLPPIYNLFIYVGRFLFSGMPEYTRLLEVMHAQAGKQAKAGRSGLWSGKEKVRAFLCYIDHYSLNFRFWDWLDERGVAHMGSILSRNFRDFNHYAKDLQEMCYTIDTSNMETMIDSIAQMNARSPMVRSIRGPYDQPNMWLEESLALADIFKADCIIYNGTPGCRNTWGMIKPFARETEAHGYPTHIMYGDAFDDRVEAWESTAERLDEFFKVRGLL
jgi:benzoyl-CoA reductase/2-hydroxyglutaryl-CoA dehydratase subunit BcrC/BadD/HgdB